MSNTIEICAVCGAANEPDAEFCTQCDAPLSSFDRDRPQACDVTAHQTAPPHPPGHIPPIIYYSHMLSWVGSAVSIFVVVAIFCSVSDEGSPTGGVMSWVTAILGAALMVAIGVVGLFQLQASLRLHHRYRRQRRQQHRATDHSAP